MSDTQPRVRLSAHDQRNRSQYTSTQSQTAAMPITLSGDAPTLFILRKAFERAELTRRQMDEALGLTPEEFQIEKELIAIGPIVGETALTELIDTLEARGLVYYEDFFELSGNWPEWLKLFAMAQ